MSAAQEPSPQAPARRHKITAQTIAEIADLVSNYRLNETEACKTLEINPKVWRNWKDRNKSAEKYDDALTRLRAGFIKGRIDTIKRAENKDWRAADRLLQIVAPERFGSRQESAPVQVAVIAENTLLKAIERVYGAQSSAANLSVDTSAPVKTLVDNPRHAESESIVDIESTKLD